MRTWIRRSLYGVGAIVAPAVIAIAAGAVLYEWRLSRHIDLDVSAVPIAAGERGLEQGRYLYTTLGCGGCHGESGGGRSFAEGEDILLVSPNISPGAGGVVAGYRPEHWVGAIRHCVKPDGRPMRFMPCEDFNRLSDADLGALVGFLTALAPAKGGKAVLDLPFPMRVLYGLGVIPDSASLIDHSLAPAAPVAAGVTLEHGRYVAQRCVGCHRNDFTGGRVPTGAPDWPPAANLTAVAGGAMSRYPDAESFSRMFDSGKRPDGQPIQVMPFEALRHFDDTDRRALHLFLKNLPARDG